MWRICKTTSGLALIADFLYLFPYSTKRFPGYDAETQQYNAEVHRNYIYGKHVANFMEHLQGEDEALYQKQFACYIKLNITPESVGCHSFYGFLFKRYWPMNSSYKLDCWHKHLHSVQLDFWHFSSTDGWLVQKCPCCHSCWPRGQAQTRENRAEEEVCIWIMFVII